MAIGCFFNRVSSVKALHRFMLKCPFWHLCNHNHYHHQYYKQLDSSHHLPLPLDILSEPSPWWSTWWRRPPAAPPRTSTHQSPAPRSRRLLGHMNDWNSLIFYRENFHGLTWSVDAYIWVQNQNTVSVLLGNMQFHLVNWKSQKSQNISISILSFASLHYCTFNDIGKSFISLV